MTKKSSAAARILEAKIEKMLCDRVVAEGGICEKLAPAGKRGFPDRTIFLPHGWVSVAELKRPVGGNIAKHQDMWRDKFFKVGTVHHYILNSADIDALFDQYHKWLAR